MNTKRDLMAPDTEPSDEELQIVMREALQSALARKKSSDVWMQQQLLDEVSKAQQRFQELRA